MDIPYVLYNTEITSVGSLLIPTVLLFCLLIKLVVLFNLLKKKSELRLQRARVCFSLFQ